MCKVNEVAEGEAGEAADYCHVACHKQRVLPLPLAPSHSFDSVITRTQLGFAQAGYKTSALSVSW